MADLPALTFLVRVEQGSDDLHSRSGGDFADQILLARFGKINLGQQPSEFNQASARGREWPRSGERSSRRGCGPRLGSGQLEIKLGHQHQGLQALARSGLAEERIDFVLALAREPVTGSSR